MDEPCKAIEELEEGECSDQEDDSMSITTNSDPVKQPDNHGRVDSGTYRQGRIPQIVINSDQSDADDSDDYGDDDDGECSLPGKKTRKFSDIADPSSGPTAFVNPLRQPGVMESIQEGAFRKKRNSVWGAVMTEQILSQDIKQFGVNAPVPGGYRDVENYDFMIAKEDDRPTLELKDEDCEEREDIFAEVVDLEREVKKHQNRKRKRNVKARLGPRAAVEERKLGDVNVTKDDDVIRVTQGICDALGEQNFALFTRIVEAIGNEKAIDLYNRTVDVENVGGMMINNGYRRRTPGGVYIQLLKNDLTIPAAIVSAVFEEEQQKWQDRRKELRKVKKAARKKWKKKEKRFDMDFDRPETPTPTKELEELDNPDEAEVDVSDLPDRPDTPEPKDSSDNESDGENDDDEEDDIAVAIAKAKAAILLKQKEMAEQKIDEDDGGEEVACYESVAMS